MSKLKIANRALNRIGAKPITDLNDENNATAVRINAIIDEVINDVQFEDYWRFMIKRTILEPVLDEMDEPFSVPFEWKWCFKLPTDFLRVVSVNGNHPYSVDEPYSVESAPPGSADTGLFIYMNREECKLVYTKKEENVERFPIHFTQAVVVLLASKIAVPIRQDENLASALLQEYQQITLPRAQSKDANMAKHGPVNITKSSQWLRSRRFSTNG